MSDSNERHEPALRAYEIRVEGRLEQRWGTRFPGMVLSSEPGGITLIRGSIRDQAALHGLLASIRDLGMSLVSVHVIGET